MSIHENPKGNKNTEELLNTLNAADSVRALEQYVEKLDQEAYPCSFRDYFLSCPQVEALGKAEVIRRSCLDRTYGYQILSGLKEPSRDKLLCLCLAAGLDDMQTRRVLELAKTGILYARNRRDSVILFAIRKGLSVIDTNLLLAEFGEDTLST